MKASEILKALRDGKTPKDLMDQGVPKNRVYNIYSRYKFLYDTLYRNFEILEDAILRLSIREFKDLKNDWERSE